MNTTNPTLHYRGLQPPRRTERAGGSIILRGILLANLAVRCIVNLPFRLLGISPDGAGRNGELPAPNIVHLVARFATLLRIRELCRAVNRHLFSAGCRQVLSLRRRGVSAQRQPVIYRAARGHSPSPIPQLQYHSSPSPAVRHSTQGSSADKCSATLPLDPYWEMRLFNLVDRIGYALPYIIGGCIISLLIYNLVIRIG